MNKRIAVVGAGNMGGRMAARFIGAGHDVTVFDLNEQAVKKLVSQGAQSAASVTEASREADIILTSLPHPKIFSTVASEIAAAATRGAVVLDASTVDPTTTVNVAKTLEVAGIDFLDIPVSGGPTGAETGTLVIMAGGNANVLAAVRPILQVISSRIVHCGDIGKGQMTKLAHNLLTAINTAALGEVLTAAVSAGADLGVLREVLSAGLAGSKMLDYLPVTLLSQERPANFALDLMNKDLGLALEEFGTKPMYLGQITRQIYNSAARSGYGADDSTGVAQVYENLNDVRLSL